MFNKYSRKMLRIKCRDLINMHVAGIFDQLLTAMNEDSSDDESAGPSTSMPSSGSRGNVRFVMINLRLKRLKPNFSGPVSQSNHPSSNKLTLTEV